MSDRPPEDQPQLDDDPVGDNPGQPDTPYIPIPVPKEEPNGGVVCSNCGHRNRPGTAICENCNTNLLSESAVSTKQLNRQDKQAMTDTGELVRDAVSTAGSNTFTEDMVLRLEIEGAATPILLFPKKETVIGRRDPATGTMPDVDLTSYAGYRMGVSRRHSVIRLRNNEVEIFDLGSSNGTAVNGIKLPPHQPQAIRDGDEITLGKMTLRVLFQLRTRRRSAP
jgi:hypothetical protein